MFLHAKAKPVFASALEVRQTNSTNIRTDEQTEKLTWFYIILDNN